MNADQAILMSGLVTAGSTVASSVLPTNMGGKNVNVSPRLLIGTGLTFATLSFVGAFAPGLAVPMAVTIAVTALMWYGIPVLETAMNTKG